MKEITDKARGYLSEKCGLTPNDSYYSNILSAFLAGAKEATRWVPIEEGEKRPSNREIVLVKYTLKDGTIRVGIATYMDFLGCNGFTMPGKPKYLTHWRPIELTTE